MHGLCDERGNECPSEVCVESVFGALRRFITASASCSAARKAAAAFHFGSSVLITACTDSGGFFVFLGLATLFLL